MPGPERLQSRLYEQAARLARLGAWECDLSSEELTWTDGVYDLFELPTGSRPTRALTLGLYFDESRRDMEAARAEVIRSGQVLSLDARIRTTRGEDRWMRLSIGVANQNGRPARLFGAKQNITAEKEAWLRLKERAERDALTGLANRAVFDARYNQVVGDKVNCGFVSALALIDINDFKQINDALGHSAGDECLRQVGTRLQRIFADAVVVARIGGDEFAVLLRRRFERVGLARMLQRASAALCKPIIWNGRRLDFGVSIGAVILEQPHPRNIAGLYDEADAALYAAKAIGRRTVRVFAGGRCGDQA